MNVVGRVDLAASSGATVWHRASALGKLLLALLVLLVVVFTRSLPLLLALHALAWTLALSSRLSPRVIVGIGLNADWAADRFPVDLAATMTSLRAASGGRPIDPILLLDGFLSRLEARIEALRAGRFDVGDWAVRQLTTGRLVRLEGHAHVAEDRLAVGVDPATGALLVADATVPGGERAIHAGEVTRIRLAEAAPSRQLTLVGAGAGTTAAAAHAATTPAGTVLGPRRRA